MPTKKIADLKKARQEKRKKKGWTMAEIKLRAAQERAAYKKLAQNEPDALASGGDMSETSKEPCDDDKDDD